MNREEHGAEKQIARPATQEVLAVVKGPSCPAAFASWWAEYRKKLAKSESAERASYIEGLQ